VIPFAKVTVTVSATPYPERVYSTLPVDCTRELAFWEPGIAKGFRCFYLATDADNPRHLCHTCGQPVVTQL
jgi:hypothetical protein